MQAREGRGEPRFVDLVLEGGGVKGIALVGALAVLEERGYEPQNVAGASAGAITAALHAAGYRADELHTILGELDFNRFLDKGLEDKLVPGALGKGLSVLLDHGIYEGEELLRWMRELLGARGVKTFGDLVHPAYADDPRYRHRLQVIASDLTGRQMLVLPRDAGLLGVKPDELEVAMAVRMSMSIPLFFEPVVWENPGNHEEHVIVDGGMLSNFPVFLFDSDGEPDWPTFGLLLTEPEARDGSAAGIPAAEPSGGPARALVSYLTSLVGTMLEAHDRMYIERADFARTITIPTLGVSTTDFDLAPEKAEALYQEGRRAAEHFLDQVFDWDGYKAEFRSGKERVSRRDQVARLMREAGAA